VFQKGRKTFLKRALSLEFKDEISSTVFLFNSLVRIRLCGTFRIEKWEDRKKKTFSIFIPLIVSLLALYFYYTIYNMQYTLFSLRVPTSDLKEIHVWEK
jgi:hypothetical protein